ncbi:MAG TPA: protein kinase [Nannocystaceae bacterium]|nr:protein kinase [Nannocystaceae bacterium]
MTTLIDDGVTLRVADPIDQEVTRARVMPSDAAAQSRIEARLFGELPSAPQIGRFVVLNKIGAGGLGIVYAAYDPKLDRRVAIKLVHRRQDFELDTQRVLREAQALARLSHPHVVAVHEVGEHDDRLFIAMELVEGTTLAEWGKASHDWRTALGPLLDAARGLAVAHRAGIVHRDFKPANVMIGHDGRARVLDFGLARGATSASGPAPSTSALDLQLTQSGTLMGTPAYLAPEQWLGAAVDARADQFSFCITALEVLWGRRPFIAADSLALRTRVLAGELDKASPRRSIPQSVERILLQGLAVDPAQRHADMEKLIAGLEREVRPPRHLFRWGLLGVGLLVVGAIAGVGMSMGARASVDTGAIEALAADARAAASAGHYVYPPSDAPDADTAYAKVVALEAMSGSELAHEQATALRDEFAGALVELGDAYWAREDARPFAIDFYAAALLFDPDQAQARERAAVTTGELALLRQRALSHDFTPGELGVADALVALAEPDAETRERKLDKVVAKETLAASTAERLHRLGSAKKPKKVAAAPAPAAAPTIAATPTPAPTPAAAAAPAPKRSPAEAKALVAEARTDLRAGRFAEANKTLHRALAFDASSHAAFSALSDLAFEQGRYAEAAEHARKAIALAPKRADYRMQLGDAYFKVLRYADARGAYEKAKSLGSKSAPAALKKIDERLGG